MFKNKKDRNITIVMLLIVVFSAIAIRKEWTFDYRLFNGVDTVATMYGYKRFTSRGNNGVYYYFKVNDSTYYGSAHVNFENCETDSLCIGKIRRVRYWQKDPSVHKIFFHDEDNGNHWLDSVKKARRGSRETPSFKAK